MSKDKRIDRICAIVMILAVLVTVLFMNGSSFGLQAVVDEDAETYTGDIYFTANDRNGTWNTDSAVQISLNGDSAVIKGGGAYFNDGDLVIKNGGYYVISGTLTDGSIVVDAYDSSKVWILLNGVTIQNEEDSAFIVLQADKVFLTLAEGTENAFADAETYGEEALEDGRNAAVYSKDDLTVNGSGSLSVTGNYAHGIKCNDDLVFAGGTIRITSVKDGIHANDSIHLTGTDITIEAGDDAVHCDTEIYYQDGTLTVNSCYEGMEAPQIEIAGGDIIIYASDDGINANGGSGDAFGFGRMGGFGTQRVNNGSDEQEENTQKKTTALSAASATADENTTASAAEDENTTASATADENTTALSDAVDSADALPTVHITGGNVTIINENGMDSDGIDSNGDIIIDGGFVLVSLLGGGGNNALDYGSESGGSLLINGGTVVAGGGASMLEEAAESSAQCNATFVWEETAPAGSVIQVTDAEGTLLLEQEMPCSFNALTLSVPDFVQGETYTVQIGDTSEEVVFDATTISTGALSGGMGGGRMGMDRTGMGGPDIDREAMSEEGTFPAEDMFRRGHAGAQGKDADGADAYSGSFQEPPEMMSELSEEELAQRMESGEFRPMGPGMQGQGFQDPPEGMSELSEEELAQRMESGEFPMQGPDGGKSQTNEEQGSLNRAENESSTETLPETASAGGGMAAEAVDPAGSGEEAGSGEATAADSPAGSGEATAADSPASSSEATAADSPAGGEATAAESLAGGGEAESGSMPGGGDMFQNNGQWGHQGGGGGAGAGMPGQSVAVQEEEPADGARALSDFGTDTWILLGACGGILLLGILFAAFYRRI